MKQTQKLTHLAILLTFALVIHTIEASLPLLPVMVPGAKLGMANIITLLTFILYGFQSAMLIAVTRAIVGSIFIGTFPGFGFILSFSGSVLSTFAMAIGLFFWQRGNLSLVSVSIMGAVAHNTAQVGAASVLINNFNLFRLYLPLLLVLAVPTGFLTGVAAEYSYPALARVAANTKR